MRRTPGPGASLAGLAGLAGKLSWSLGANVISLGISLFTSLAIPGWFADDVASYGYFQIFVFYAGYVGFLHLGACDGIGLRDAGRDYASLDHGLYAGEFWLVTAFEAAVGLAVALLGLGLADDPGYRFIWCMMGLTVAAVIPRQLLSCTLQATGRVREYAVLTAAGRLCFGAAVLAVMLTGRRRFEYLVCAQVLGELAALAPACWYCRDILTHRPAPLRACLRECAENVSAGYKLLVSNAAGLLIPGIARIAIQLRYDAAAYGRASFAFMAANLTLTFISAIELVLYPDLKQRSAELDREALGGIYRRIDGALMGLIFGGAVLYVPGSALIGRLLPQYAGSLVYIACLLPMCAFSSRMGLLTQNYMKIFRMEREIMRSNLLTAALTLGLTAAVLALGGDMIWLMLTVTAAHVFRCAAAERSLRRASGIASDRGALDILMALAFLICMTRFDGRTAAGLYAACYLAYLALKRVPSAGRRNGGGS